MIRDVFKTMKDQIDDYLDKMEQNEIFDPIICEENDRELISNITKMEEYVKKVDQKYAQLFNNRIRDYIIKSIQYLSSKLLILNNRKLIEEYMNIVVRLAIEAYHFKFYDIEQKINIMYLEYMIKHTIYFVLDIEMNASSYTSLKKEVAKKMAEAIYFKNNVSISLLNQLIRDNGIKIDVDDLYIELFYCDIGLFKTKRFRDGCMVCMEWDDDKVKYEMSLKYSHLIKKK